MNIFKLKSSTVIKYGQNLKYTYALSSRGLSYKPCLKMSQTPILNNLNQSRNLSLSHRMFDLAGDGKLNESNLVFDTITNTELNQLGFIGI